jgi:hypothetical protein
MASSISVVLQPGKCFRMLCSNTQSRFREQIGVQESVLLRARSYTSRIRLP